MEIEGQPGRFVNGTRARWLIQARRARLTGNGKLTLLPGPEDDRREARDDGAPVRWGAFSRVGVTNQSGWRSLDGYRMNGAAINHG
ncbi:MAG TPA: hypothetical protein VN709_03970 [Terriglobales bacterium]|nr:hypothetical protein [Terriglobales bacterium]